MENVAHDSTSLPLTDRLKAGHSAAPRGLSAGLHRSEMLSRATMLVGQATDDTPHSRDQPLPTRLVEIGAGPSPASARLVEPDPGTSGTYMTLSYRWSSACDHVTTQRNKAQYMQQIDLDTLPKTFVDVMWLCWGMEVRYLWIDSLCIVQDDPADWERESKLMGDVYSNALCCLAAHSDPGDAGGCLPREKKLPILQGKHGELFRVSLRDVFWEDMALNSAIVRRGWVLQERLLSSHILHLLPTQIYLESALGKVVDVESGRSHYSTKMPNLVSIWPSPSLATSRRDSRGTQVKRWQRIVEWYSLCGLSKTSDKLPALSGIAAKIQNNTMGDYLAGMWGESFRQDLLWLSVDSTRSRRPARPRVSTWSWASLDGAIMYLHVSGAGRAYSEPKSARVSNFDGPDIGELLRQRGGPWGPIWIDRPTPLACRGSLGRLPKLGSSRIITKGEYTGHAPRLTSEFPGLVGVRARPILLDNSNSNSNSNSNNSNRTIVGEAFLDIDSEDRPVDEEFGFFWLSDTELTKIILIVSLGEEGKHKYQRVGCSSAGQCCVAICKGCQTEAGGPVRRHLAHDRAGAGHPGRWRGDYPSSER